MHSTTLGNLLVGRVMDSYVSRTCILREKCLCVCYDRRDMSLNFLFVTHIYIYIYMLFHQ